MSSSSSCKRPSESYMNQPKKYSKSWWSSLFINPSHIIEITFWSCKNVCMTVRSVNHVWILSCLKNYKM
jgi:hypothetical protein